LLVDIGDSDLEGEGSAGAETGDDEAWEGMKGIGEDRDNLTISPIINMFSPRISCNPIGSSPKRPRVVLKWRRTVF
jgi:hypothetical protein